MARPGWRLCSGAARPRTASSVCSSASGVRIYLAPGLQLVLPVDHDDVPRGDPSGDRCHVILGERNRNRVHCNRFVGFDRKHIASLRAGLDRDRRNHGASLVGFQQQADIDELVGPQRVVRIVEHGFQPPRAGGLVDLIVDRQQLAGGQLRLIVAAVGFDLQRALVHVLRYVLQIIFRQSENYSDRLQLGDHEQRIGVGGMHHVAHIHQPQPDAATDGSCDVRVHQVEFGVVDL